MLQFVGYQKIIKMILEHIKSESGSIENYYHGNKNFRHLHCYLLLGIKDWGSYLQEPTPPETVNLQEQKHVLVLSVLEVVAQYYTKLEASTEAMASGLVF